ncbi:sine oculis-binding protein homolog B [Culicoides brevitarsis]|uniref:sine oculis-binding protein homolog B n=1 Tax=Culicoides brevitarsis TaxID=469753 RepID=UPI00307B773F
MNAKASPLLVKKESCSDDIKDYAESAMNELLGWYGYDKINQNEIKPTYSRKKLSDNAESKNESSCSNSAVGICDDSEYESLCDSSKSHFQVKGVNHENICSWCRRTVSTKSPEVLGSPDGPLFCSESCFSQSRRANFKRAKVCDWCKHVRNAVNYVDFQDNAAQLQFCSDKCLNQYKMQIFCNETQAHLEANPHLKEKIDISNGLITPDLWLKNCRSETPISEPSERTPSPALVHTIYAKPSSPHSINQGNNESNEKKPLITVAPVSKLLNKNFAPRPPLRTVKRRRLRAFRNILPFENNNNNADKAPILKESSKLDPKLQEQDRETPHVVPPPRQPHPMFRPLHPLLRSAPPVTIMVPYPILLPLVIPIPIPLPILKPDDLKKTECTKSEEPNTSIDHTRNTHEQNEEKTDKVLNDGSPEELGKVNEENAEHKLPKFKITRLSTKRNLVRECEKEKNRPLRKRKFDHHQIIELEDEKNKNK